MKFTRKKEDIIKKELELIERKRVIEFEKNDTLALIIAAFTTIFPFLIVALGLFVGIIWFAFLR